METCPQAVSNVPRSDPSPRVAAPRRSSQWCGSTLRSANAVGPRSQLAPEAFPVPGRRSFSSNRPGQFRYRFQLNSPRSQCRSSWPLAPGVTPPRRPLQIPKRHPSWAMGSPLQNPLARRRPHPSRNLQEPSCQPRSANQLRRSKCPGAQGPHQTRSRSKERPPNATQRRQSLEMQASSRVSAPARTQTPQRRQRNVADDYRVPTRLLGPWHFAVSTRRRVRLWNRRATSHSTDSRGTGHSHDARVECQLLELKIPPITRAMQFTPGGQGHCGADRLARLRRIRAAPSTLFTPLRLRDDLHGLDRCPDGLDQPGSPIVGAVSLGHAPASASAATG